MYRKFSRDTEENIHSELSEINWDLAMRNCGDNADAGFSKFFNSLNKIVYLRNVFILQKRALRLMFFAGNRSHATPMFVPPNVLALNMLYFETV